MTSISPPARIASSRSLTSDFVKATGDSLQRALGGSAEVVPVTNLTVDLGFYTTRRDVNARGRNGTIRPAPPTRVGDA
jgi:hypothetical protein